LVLIHAGCPNHNRQGFSEAFLLAQYFVAIIICLLFTRHGLLPTARGIPVKKFKVF
jgi:hypothetical protein